MYFEWNMKVFANPYILKHVEDQVLICYKPNNEIQFVVLRFFSAMTYVDFVTDSNVLKLMRKKLIGVICHVYT